MNLDLHGKNALVGGGSKGLGKACAIELAALGATVTLVARGASELQTAILELPTPSGQQHRWITANYDHPEQVASTLQLLFDARPCHILINNTGGPAGGPIADADPEAFRIAFNRHLIVNQLLAQLVLPGMKDEGYGRILNIISTSVKQPLPGLGVSNTVRGAVANWAKTLATEVAPWGITVNNVLPGATRTQRLSSIIAARADKTGLPVEDVVRHMMAEIPSGRFAEPAEFAAAVAFLASPAAAYITGINLPVDGGRTACL
jgi:3-oxoacyl-[acyl-carrier protein] reductase